MMYVVKQPFSTPSRRFSPGDMVTGADLAGPVPVAGWADLKMIEPVKPAKGGKAGDTAPPPADSAS